MLYRINSRREISNYSSDAFASLRSVNNLTTVKGNCLLVGANWTTFPFQFETIETEDSDQEDSVPEEDIKQFGIFRVAIHTATLTSCTLESRKADATAEEYEGRLQEEQEALSAFSSAVEKGRKKLPEARKNTLSESAAFGLPLKGDVKSTVTQIDNIPDHPEVIFTFHYRSKGILSVLGIEVEEMGGILPVDIFTVKKKEEEKKEEEEEEEEEEEGDEEEVATVTNATTTSTKEKERAAEPLLPAETTTTPKESTSQLTPSKSIKSKNVPTPSASTSKSVQVIEIGSSESEVESEDDLGSYEEWREKEREKQYRAKYDGLKRKREKEKEVLKKKKGKMVKTEIKEESVASSSKVRLES